MEQGQLVLVLDAIDEAPWRAGGTKLGDAVAKLSEEVKGKSGLLITSRTGEVIPPLEALHATASLGGIHPDDLEGFLAQYAGGRAGVSQLVERLTRMTIRDSIKYSPLVLRRLAEGLSIRGEPNNLVELFEQMADFHIARECSKPVVPSSPGSWQAGYADEIRHRNLVNTLVFGASGRGQTISEQEFETIILDILSPSVLGARALVEISTLMAEHPLVTVRYRPDDMERDAYLVTCSHDWVRTALFPKFLGDSCIDSQIYVSETWQDGLPYPDDFIPAWDYLGDHAQQRVETLVNLVFTQEQAFSVMRWIVPQLFNVEISKPTKNLLFSLLARMAYRLVPPHSSILEHHNLELEEGMTGPLFLEGAQLTLDRNDQLGNLAGVTLESVDFVVADNGPLLLTIANSWLRRTTFIVQTAALVTLKGCILEAVVVRDEGGATIVLEGCTYDPETCSFPEHTQGLETCEEADIAAASYRTYALVEVLRRLILGFNPERPELTRKKANVAEHNIYKGVIRDLRESAERIVNIMVEYGYAARKPTGGIKRIDPSAHFDAYEAARFIARPNVRGQGPMTGFILERLERTV